MYESRMVTFNTQPGRLKAFSTGGGAKGTLCGIMKLKNLLFAKGREY